MHATSRSHRPLRALVPLVALLLMTHARPATADAPDAAKNMRVPLGEAGLMLMVFHRPGHPVPGGGDNDSYTNVGVAMRADVGLLPLFLDTGKLRGGDFLGLDLGVSFVFAPLGKIYYGGQISYEIRDDLGLGARLYFMTAFDGGDYLNYLVGELTVRFRKYLARVRSSVTTTGGLNSGYDARDLGLSLRIPTKWSFLGYPGWHAGLEYDRFAYEDATGNNVLHFFGAIVALQF